MSSEALEDQAVDSAPRLSAGGILSRAREAAKLSIAQVSEQTRINPRHIAALEAGDYAALPARTYALAFARSCARVVGADEGEVVSAVRADFADLEPETVVRAQPTFEPGDPARVPGARLAWGAGLGALALVIAGLVFWKGYYAPGGSLPSLLPDAAPSPSAAPAHPTAAAPAAASTGPVIFTALEPGIWVKFYDGAGAQLMQKQLAQGESWTVPANVPEVKIWTGRPEALAITIGGKPVPKLSDTQKTMKDVSVTAAALLARGAPAVPGAVPAVPAAGQHVPPPHPVAAPVHVRAHHDAPAPAAPEAAAPAPDVAAPAAPVAAAPVPAAT